MSLLSLAGGLVGGIVGGPAGAAVGAAAGSAVGGGGSVASGVPGSSMFGAGLSGSAFIQALYNHAIAGETYYRAWLADIADDGTGTSSVVGEGLHHYNSSEQNMARTLLAQLDALHPPGSYGIPSAPYTYPPLEPTGVQPTVASWGVTPSAGAAAALPAAAYPGATSPSILGSLEKAATVGINAATAELAGTVAGGAAQIAQQAQQKQAAASIFPTLTTKQLLYGAVGVVVLIGAVAYFAAKKG